MNYHGKRHFYSIRSENENMEYALVFKSVFHVRFTDIIASYHSIRQHTPYIYVPHTFKNLSHAFRYIYNKSNIKIEALVLKENYSMFILHYIDPISKLSSILVQKSILIFLSGSERKPFNIVILMKEKWKRKKGAIPDDSNECYVWHGYLPFTNAFIFFTFHKIVKRMGTLLYETTAISRSWRGRQCGCGRRRWHSGGSGICISQIFIRSLCLGFN